MKTINVSDEMYAFLVGTGKDIISQDNRGTRTPIVYVVMSKYEEMRPDGYAEKQKIIEEEEGMEIEVKEIVARINKHYYDEDFGDMLYVVKGVKKLLSKAKTLEDLQKIIDIEEFIKKYCKHWRMVHYDEMFRPKTSEGGFFLTEKACDAHLKINGHHYREPHSYVEYANRNAQIETLVTFLMDVARGAASDE